MKSAPITNLYNVEGRDTAPGELLSPKRNVAYRLFNFSIFLFSLGMTLSMKTQKKKKENVMKSGPSQNYTT